MKSTIVGAVAALAVAMPLAACTSSSAESPVPTAPVSEPAVSAPAQQAPNSAKAKDPAGLVAAMWKQLSTASQQQLCGIYASQGSKAGDVFVAGAEQDVKASILTEADKADIATAGSALLAAKCAATGVQG